MTGVGLGPPLAEIESARGRIAGSVVRTPTLQLELDGPARLFVKLENLQPIGSFKLRGALNAMLSTPRDELEAGVWTASAGNMAQGVAWGARSLGIPCQVVVPDTAPETKLDAIERLGGHVVETSIERWFEVFETRRFEGMTGRFIHAFNDPLVMAGNGTIALEILEDVPDVETVIVPFGGGGLACGIASAFRGSGSGVRVLAAEVEGQAPLAASFEAGKPVEIDYTPTFVDGIGGPYVSADMFELADALLDGSLVVSLEEVADAIKLLVERTRVVAEGAGAASVAAARAVAEWSDGGTVVCVVSGGNLDGARLQEILSGCVPT